MQIEMSNKSKEEVYWKLENGEKISLLTMEEAHFQSAYQVLQKRQLRAYSTLEFSIKMEQAFEIAAKERKISLINLADTEKDTSISRAFREVKTIIAKITKSIKTEIIKKAKNEKQAERLKILLPTE